MSVIYILLVQKYSTSKVSICEDGLVLDFGLTY